MAEIQNTEETERPKLTMKPNTATAGDYARFTGRKVITSSFHTVTRDNLIKVIEEAMVVHRYNSGVIEYLKNYELGIQPILSREKEFRPTVNNKVVENRAHEILQFKNGYQFGSGGFYVALDKETENVELLNREMGQIGKEAYDLELGYWMFLCGQGYRMILPGTPEDPIDMTILDSRYTAYVRRRDLKKSPLTAFTYAKYDEHITYYGYTDTHYYEVLDNKVIKWTPHTIGRIPIVEYVLNVSRMGVFERVLHILDAINLIQSDRINGVEQFVQAYWKFINVDIEDKDIENIPTLGAIKGKGIPGLPPVIDYMSLELDQSQVQTLKDDLYQSALIITSMPDRQGTNRSAGDTGMAVELRDGWANAETDAKEIAKLYRRPEKETIQLMIKYMNIFQGVNINPRNVDIKFLRTPRNDRVSSSQAMLNELTAGVHPKHVLTNSNLYPDAEQVYNDSGDFMTRKWDPSLQAESTNDLGTPVESQPRSEDDQ